MTSTTEQLHHASMVSARRRAAGKLVKRTIRERGHMYAAAVFMEPPADADHLQVERVLRSIPAVGPTKVTKVMRRCSIEHGTRLRDLDQQDRLALARTVHNRLWR